MAAVRLLYGSARSGRARQIDDWMCTQWRRALLIVPTRRYARVRTEELILGRGLDGAWGKPVFAFDDFAAHLVQTNGLQATRIQDVERRFLLERAVARLRETGALDAVGDAANTAGFVSHVLRVIVQLKQAAIEPYAFRQRVTKRSGSTPLDLAVAEIYDGYQRALLEAGVYDVPGLFWQADLLCGEGRPRALESVETVLLDGFDDFTPSEFRLIESIERHVDLLAIGLNYDPAPDRQDLYEVPARTSKRIRERFVPELFTFDESPAESHAEFAASHIFWRNRSPLPT
ncbi:MAG: hypothetical protein QG656_1695, partial [Candidatus Hydrogenedentes bacterium]|nr:hypothetical protein [Candidatus Hydrogenedentota bacterium]